jgi:hypothetical protein
VDPVAVIRLLGVGYLVSSVAGTVIAIKRDERAAFAGLPMSTGSPSKDFLIGCGTALSPPAVMLVALVGLMRTRRRRLIRALGVAFTIGQLGEPITWRTMRAPTRDPLVMTIVAANIALPMLMTKVRA